MKVRNLLIEISEAEFQVERSRQWLCQDTQFDAIAAFESIDADNIQCLYAHDLMRFLKFQNTEFSSKSINLLLEQYSSAGNSGLYLPDFLQLVLPSEDQKLRKKTESRNKKLPKRVLKKLAKHLQLESSLQVKLDNLKQKIVGSGAEMIFEQFDAHRKEFIDRKDLAMLIKTQDDLVVDRIIRRIDTQGDGVIYKKDFIEGICPSGSRRYNGVEELIELFLDYINADREFRRIKKRLLENSSFTTNNLYNLFDSSGKGFINSHDIERLMTQLNICFTSDDVYLLLRNHKSIDGSILNKDAFMGHWNFENTKQTLQTKSLAFHDLKNCMISYIGMNKVIEDARVRLSEETWVKLYEIFQQLDYENKEFLDKHTFKKLFNTNQSDITDEDILGLLNAFSENQAITFADLVQEITPKIINFN